jgi:hypothetical protein
VRASPIRAARRAPSLTTSLTVYFRQAEAPNEILDGLHPDTTSLETVLERLYAHFVATNQGIGAWVLVVVDYHQQYRDDAENAEKLAAVYALWHGRIARFLTALQHRGSIVPTKTPSSSPATPSPTQKGSPSTHASTPATAPASTTASPASFADSSLSVRSALSSQRSRREALRRQRPSVRSQSVWLSRPSDLPPPPSAG